MQNAAKPGRFRRGTVLREEALVKIKNRFAPLASVEEDGQECRVCGMEGVFDLMANDMDVDSGGKKAKRRQGPIRPEETGRCEKGNGH